MAARAPGAGATAILAERGSDGGSVAENRPDTKPGGLIQSALTAAAAALFKT